MEKLSFKTKNVGGVIINVCEKCETPLQLADETTPFCPQCKTSALPEGMIAKVLCCNECKKPVSMTFPIGCHCTHCGFAPSLQDVFLQNLEESI